jgi:hypothetical protein
MQTIGCWCDECRTKYVKHVCKKGLPCGHDAAQAVLVYAKSWGRGYEAVSLRCGDFAVALYIADKPVPGVSYSSGGRELWGSWLKVTDGLGAGQEMTVGEWLTQQEEKIGSAHLGTDGRG